LQAVSSLSVYGGRAKTRFDNHSRILKSLEQLGIGYQVKPSSFSPGSSAIV